MQLSPTFITSFQHTMMLWKLSLNQVQ